MMPTFTQRNQPSIARRIAELVKPSQGIPQPIAARPDFFSAASHLVKAVNAKQKALAQVASNGPPKMRPLEQKILRSVHLQERGK